VVVHSLLGKYQKRSERKWSDFQHSNKIWFTKICRTTILFYDIYNRKKMLLTSSDDPKVLELLQTTSSFFVPFRTSRSW
jgi:hypothetical protein